MDRMIQKKTKEMLQVELAEYLSNYRDVLTLPEFNFLKDMILGILKSQSVIQLRIAKELNETVSLKKICERFTNHLSKQNLEKRLSDEILRIQCRKINDDTAIIVDESDIIKNYAEKMEGLTKVRDGSTGDCSKLGYHLLNIISFRDDNKGYQIEPLYSELISYEKELYNIAYKLDQITKDIAERSQEKGVYLFDRGFDRRKFIETISKKHLNYVIRSTGNRNLIVDDQEVSFYSVIKSMKLKNRMNIEGQEIKCAIRQVELRTDPHPKKNPNKVKLWLVSARFHKHKDDKSGRFYFLCNFSGQPHLTEKQIMEKAIRMYRKRWKIEEVHRHVKVEYKWEDMQLSSYSRLRNMNLILLIALSFLYSLKRFVEHFAVAFPNIFKYSNTTMDKIYRFVYYKLSNLVRTCFASVTRYKICPYKGRNTDSMQLKLPF